MVDAEPEPRYEEKMQSTPHGLCWAYVIGLWVNEKVQNTGDSLRCGLNCFSSVCFF